jgi:ABC-2 type transport system permease protein
VPGLALALVIGTASCAALGTGVLRLITSAESATAVTAGLVLPLTFISGVWGDFGNLPGWLDTIAKLFPIQHLAHALQVAFDPRTAGAGISGTDLLVLGVWLVAGTALGMRALRAELRRD